MPAGKYTFYLHSDDRTDMLAARTIETVSQPLRGDFIRTAALAGFILYQTDVRLPGLVTELFDGRLSTGQLSALAAAVSGRYTLMTGMQDESEVRVVSAETAADDKAERRRFTLVLPDDDGTRCARLQIESVSTRLRGQLLRNLIVAGCALHTLEPRFPRLLASLPAPPDSPQALVVLAGQLTGSVPEPEQGRAEAPPPAGGAAQPVPSPQIVSNMKKLF
ncbi:plasmid partitioning/stability family protein [Salmonella enterica]|uniref:plasmid partitioning/stability family protein n=1 Tax=Salmonella enterica TaxID=28901 RepID=UPI002015FC02|nr:plasmid partitioning/stability family protein [Salmonella enterica]